MWKFQIFFFIVMASLVASEELKCFAFMQDLPNMHKCCKLPIPIDEKALEPVWKQNLTFCEKKEKITEILNLKNADKTMYKNYLTKMITDGDWKPIFLKSSDSCFDLVPKIITPFAKKVNLTEEGCGAKLILTVNCWMAAAFSDCPAKFYTDSDECKKLTKIIKECLANPSDIAKSFEAAN